MTTTVYCSLIKSFSKTRKNNEYQFSKITEWDKKSLKSGILSSLSAHGISYLKFVLELPEPWPRQLELEKRKWKTQQYVHEERDQKLTFLPLLSGIDSRRSFAAVSDPSKRRTRSRMIFPETLTFVYPDHSWPRFSDWVAEQLLDDKSTRNVAWLWPSAIADYDSLLRIAFPTHSLRTTLIRI